MKGQDDLIITTNLSSNVSVEIIMKERKNANMQEEIPPSDLMSVTMTTDRPYPTKVWNPR